MTDAAPAPTTAERTRSTSKRQRADQSELSCESASKRARNDFFDAVVTGCVTKEGAITRAISSADDLEKPELLRCFELLHACGAATQPAATLASTRRSIEGFLEAIFNGWRVDSENSESGDAPKPLMDIAVDDQVVVGRYCGGEDTHKDYSECENDDDCLEVIVSISYTSTPSEMTINMSIPAREGPDADYPAIFCDPNIRWKCRGDWSKKLRLSFEDKFLCRVHRHNKHLAVWHAREMIKSWEKGEDNKDWAKGDWGFTGVEKVRAVLMGFGCGL